MIALALLAAAAGAGLNPLPLLALLIPGLAVFRARSTRQVGHSFVGGALLLRERSRGRALPVVGSAHETVIATIYVRRGRLVLRRRVLP